MHIIWHKAEKSHSCSQSQLVLRRFVELSFGGAEQKDDYKNRNSSKSLVTGLLHTREFFLLVVCVLCAANTACRNPNQNKHNQISNKLQTAARTSQTDKRNEISQMQNGQTAYFNKQGKEKQMWGYLQKKTKKTPLPHLIMSCNIHSGSWRQSVVVLSPE